MPDPIPLDQAGTIVSPESRKPSLVKRAVEALTGIDMDADAKEANRRAVVVRSIRIKLLERPAFERPALCNAIGIPHNVLDTFAERSIAPSDDVLSKLVDLLDGTVWLSPSFELAPVSSRPRDVKPFTGQVDSSGTKEVKVPAPDKTRQPWNSPNLSREEAAVLFNILVRCDEPVPLRAIRDSTRQGLSWDGTDDDYRVQRLDKISAILVDNGVIFPAPNRERPHAGLVRVAAAGLAFVKQQT